MFHHLRYTNPAMFWTMRNAAALCHAPAEVPPFMHFPLALIPRKPTT